MIVVAVYAVLTLGFIGFALWLCHHYLDAPVLPIPEEYDR